MTQIKSFDIDEKLYAAVYTHWITSLTPFLLYLTGLGLAIFTFILPNFFPDNWLEFGAWVRLFAFAIFLVVHHWAFIYTFHWALSPLLITNKRLILFEFFPYVRHDVKYLSLLDVHEVEREKEGLLQNIFNYGTLKVDLTATLEPVTIEDLPHVALVANLIQSLLKEYKGEPKPQPKTS